MTLVGSINNFFLRNHKLLICAAILIYILIEAQRVGDFYIFLEASRLLQNGEDIYAAAFGNDLHYLYSPLFAVILIPFTWLPDYFTKVIWLIANVYFVSRIFKIITLHLDLKMFSPGQIRLFWIIGIVLSIRFLFNIFHLMQMNIFLLYAILEGVYQITNKRSLKGSSVLSLAMNIKILPVIILPWLLYRGYFTAVFYCFLLLVSTLLIPAIFIGWDYNLALHQSWWDIINPSNSEHIIDIAETGFHSLTTFFAVYLLEGAHNQYDLTLSRNVADLSITTVTIIINISRALLVLGTLWFLKTRPFVKPLSVSHRFWELSYILAVAPLIFPHQQYYAFLFLMPAFFYLTYRWIISNRPKNLLISLVIVFLLCSFIGGIMGSFRDYARHFKLITFGGLITLVLLAWFPPVKEAEKQIAGDT